MKIKMPNHDVPCYEEINLWLKLGWIRLYGEEKLNIKESTNLYYYLFFNNFYYILKYTIKVLW